MINVEGVKVDVLWLFGGVGLGCVCVDLVLLRERQSIAVTVLVLSCNGSGTDPPVVQDRQGPSLDHTWLLW